MKISNAKIANTKEKVAEADKILKKYNRSVYNDDSSVKNLYDFF